MPTAATKAVEYPSQSRVSGTIHLRLANPAPSEGDSVWYVGTMDPGQQGKILVRGKLSGARREGVKVEP